MGGSVNLSRPKRSLLNLPPTSQRTVFSKPSFCLPLSPGPLSLQEKNCSYFFDKKSFPFSNEKWYTLSGIRTKFYSFFSMITEFSFGRIVADGQICNNEIKLIAGHTSEAINTFNRLFSEGKQVSGGFHVD